MTDPAASDADPAGRSGSRSPDTLPPIGWLAWLPWIAAGGFALAAGMLLAAYIEARSEAVAMGERAALAGIAEKSMRQTLEAERILAARRLADLTANPPGVSPATDTDYIALIPRHGESRASAVAVWNPRTRAGVLIARNLPTLRAKQSYRLWIGDTDTPPWSVGTFAVAADGTARFAFKSPRPAAAGIFFAVSAEQADVAAAGPGPAVLSSQ